MTRAITEQEHTNMQYDRQAARLLALVDPGTVVFRALINQSFSSYDGVVELTYDTVTMGAYTDIEPDMTLLVGSVLGGHDIGVTRIRKAADGTKIYIAEESSLAFANNQHLTVLSSWDPFVKNPRVASDILYMDYDVAYSDQHENKAPVPVLGIDRVVNFVWPSVDVYFDGSDSYDMAGGTVSFVWTCATASALADDTTDSPTIT